MTATGLALLVGAGAYTLLTATLKLYADNFSLNHSHHTARMPLERMIREINNSGTPPILVNEKGVDVAGNGPAPGVRFCTLASASPYAVVDAAAATATSVRIRVNSGQPKPRKSDILLVHASPEGQFGNGIQVEIKDEVTGASSPYTVTLKSALGVNVSANSSALLMQQGAFIVVGGQLRYYNRVMSEAQPSSLFHAPASFRALAQVEPVPGQAQAAPFSYVTPDHRLLRVDLRARSPRYSNRVANFNSFLNMQSSIAVKSVYLDATKLTAIQ